LLSSSLINLFIINVNILIDLEKNIKDNKIVIEKKLIIKGAKKRGKVLKEVNILNNI
jgi:hypothetical protein